MAGVGLTIDEVLSWDAEAVREVFSAGQDRANTTAEVSTSLGALDVFESWGGDASIAAQSAIAKTRQDLDEHGRQVMVVANACAAAADQIDQVKSDLKDVVEAAERDTKRVTLDRATGTVNPVFDSPLTWADNLITALDYKNKIDALLAQADGIDDTLAAAINYADGDATVFPEIPGAGTDLTTRLANQSAAFEEIFGRVPTSAADWQTAAALDPHSYEDKNLGHPPEIVVARIEPQPGQGVVETNFFIPSEKVAYPDPTEPGIGYNRGDDRGFDINATPEQSRVSLLVDYENGIIVTRQNPSVSADDPTDVRIGEPLVSATQGADGSVYIKYDTVDPFPFGDDFAQATPWVVDGELVVSPGVNGPEVGGIISSYPAVEIYGTSPTGEVTTMLQQSPWNLEHGIPGELGPITGLPFDQSVGNVGLLDQYVTTSYDPNGMPHRLAPQTTSLGSVDAPPVVRTHN